jgi:uncharacterized lipoprotein YajG
MKKVFKTLMPLVSLSIFIVMGCRKQDQTIPNPNTTASPSDANAQNGANGFDSYMLNHGIT